MGYSEIMQFRSNVPHTGPIFLMGQEVMNNDDQQTSLGIGHNPAIRIIRQPDGTGD